MKINGKLVDDDKLAQLFLMYLMEFEPRYLFQIILEYREKNSDKDEEYFIENFKAHITKLAIEKTIKALQFTEKKKMSRRVKIDKTDYLLRANDLLVHARSKWIDIVKQKQVSLENIRQLRKLYKGIFVLLRSDGGRVELRKAKIICSKCQSFLSECSLKIVLKRNYEPRSVTSASMPNGQARRGLKKGERTPESSTLTQDILAIVPTLGAKVLNIPKRGQRNLLKALSVVGEDDVMKESIVAHPGLRSFLKDKSNFMEAVRFGEQFDIRQILNIKPEITAIDQVVEKNWDCFRLPSDMTVRMIGGPCLNNAMLLKAVREISDSFDIIDSEKIRAVENAMESAGLIILVKGLISHKVSMKAERLLDGSRLIYINQANPTTICREIALACTAKGIGFFV